ncbi:MAG: gamma-glutamyl-gamma-aminobutyrate hydrolase family protein [Verrucomicrobiae bacterium]|nr:gamma-glutamyl-gamma-aminobutyrate hydrolase family protein [Verrucomicrobiae bacterium]
MKAKWCLAFWWAFVWLACGALEPAVPRPLEEIYPGVAELRATTDSVICLLDTEHPDERRRVIGDRTPNVHPLESLRMRLELEWAGLRCLLVHPALLTPADLARAQVKAVLVTPRSKSPGAAADRHTWALIRECKAPMLFTGGAQALLVMAYGGKVGNMRKLRADEPDPAPGYLPGWFKEIGYLPVRIVERDPLFDGLGDTFTVYQHHASEVKVLPPEFKVLASTEEYRVQVCRLRDRPHYGVIFAPERFSERHPDGKRILQNFFRLAGVDPQRELPKARAAARKRIRQLVGAVCQDPDVLRRQTRPFVMLVDVEGPEAVASPRRGSGSGMTHAEKIEQFRGRIEKELAHLPCVVVHHAELTREDFSNPHLRAIVLTGATSPSVKPLCEDLFAVIREGKIPLLGVCAGHQHIGLAHGAETELMRLLRPGEKDPNPKYHPGRFKEWGFMPVQIVQRDPLFDGLPDTIIVQQYHVGKLKSLPSDFELLARTDECEVQVMKRRGKPVYGTQFHPENYDEAHPHGKRLLQNFFKIAAAAER